MLGNEKALWLFFVVVALLLPAYAWCFWRKTTALKILASSDMLKKINISVSLSKQIFKAVLLIVAFAAIVVALTEPKWNPRINKVKRKGRDVAIVLDVSRSMLAEDIKPSRIEWAKTAIRDLMETLAGDRIAIVTFAGTSTVKCPLTQDYAFVRLALEDISTESTGKGGTNIGDAIRKTTKEVFDKGSTDYKDIILITDGEEHEGQDSFPVQAAENAAQEGIRIIAIGLGDEIEGARIPITDSYGNKTYLKYNNEEVWTKLGGKVLREIAYATQGGRFKAVEPGTTLYLGDVYEELIALAQKRELESAGHVEYDEKFQIFLALAMILIVCEVFISERRKV